jgi:hypothetical protein
MKKIFLTVVHQVVNEKGEALIEKAMNTDNREQGLPRSWYTEQNLRPPKDLEEGVELDEDGAVILDEEHLEYDSLKCTVIAKNIDSYTEAAEIGSVVYTRTGLSYHVYETIEEIDYQLMGKLELLKIRITLLWNKLTKKSKGI